MRTLKRNQVAFTYRLRSGQTETYDASGYNTGRPTQTYTDYSGMGNVIVNGGSSMTGGGIDDNYSLVIIPDNPIPVDTTSLITYGGKSYRVVSVQRTLNSQRVNCDET